ncbi:uncharacterized membrane protein YkvA (DUF1232 family) [Alkalibacillus flavidus]|uniref:Uncharacterized membrane protein YkvA (DUF1232 family) n=1 Tax=Alkalibacillus flavidus TaxID=546021 RepID=A0ABV2KXR9_9BACI
MNKKNFNPKKLFEDFKTKNEGKIKEYANSPQKLKTLANNAEEKARENSKSLSNALDQIKLLVEFLKAWKNNEYRDVSKQTIVWIIVALLYFVSPLDAYPDFLPLGYVDDIALLGYVYKSIKDDLDKFKAWKYGNNNEFVTKE